MNKKVLLLAIVLLMISISLYLLKQKGDERALVVEPITIEYQASYVRMSLDDLITESDLIVIGDLKTVHASRWNTPDGKRPEGISARSILPDHVIFTDLNINVNQIIKGDVRQKNARIRSLGGNVDNDQMIADKIIPEMGKTYLLFLSLDVRGSTANIGPGHYWITGGGFQGMYEIVSDKAISKTDEWALDELIAYIQKTLFTESPSPALSPVPTELLIETLTPSLTITPTELLTEMPVELPTQTSTPTETVSPTP
ncbi:MAG: hypothetical protein IH589_04750 [Anaerolineales bacterium]|nr:hypothetical protein [Anaerolineales bacterium]